MSQNAWAVDLLIGKAEEQGVKQGAGTLEQYGDYTMRRNYGDRHLYGGGVVAKEAGSGILKAIEKSEPVLKPLELLHAIFFKSAECAAECIEEGESTGVTMTR